MKPQDQRRYPRYRVEGIAEMTRPGDKVALRAPLVDISVGGFYVETMTPMPEGTELQVTLEIGPVELYAQGVVETCHQNIGNGIGFSQMTTENEQALQAVILGITKSGQIARVAEVQHTFSPELEALISLLERKSLITRNELVLEMRAKAAAKS